MGASIARKGTHLERRVLCHQPVQGCASSCIMTCFSCAAMVFRYSKRARTFFTKYVPPEVTLLEMSPCQTLMCGVAYSCSYVLLLTLNDDYLLLIPHFVFVAFLSLYLVQHMITSLFLLHNCDAFIFFCTVLFLNFSPCSSLQGLIFVVDSNDRERIAEAKEELQKMVSSLPSVTQCVLPLLRQLCFWLLVITVWMGKSCFRDVISKIKNVRCSFCYCVSHDVWVSLNMCVGLCCVYLCVWVGGWCVSVCGWVVCVRTRVAC